MLDEATKLSAQHQQWLTTHTQLKPLANDWNYYQHSFNQFLNATEQLKTTAHQNQKLVAEQAKQATLLTTQNAKVESQEQLLASEQKILTN